MAGLEAGMVCVKTHGRQAGKRVIVLEFDKKTGMAIVEGPFVRKRKCNARHLLPTGKKGDPKEFSCKMAKKVAAAGKSSPSFIGKQKLSDASQTKGLQGLQSKKAAAEGKISLGFLQSKKAAKEQKKGK